MSSCPSPATNTLGQLVRSAISDQRHYASNAITSLNTAIADFRNNLSELDSLGIETELTWNGLAIGAGWQSPSPPGSFTDSYATPSAPADVVIPEPSLPSFEDFPDSPNARTIDIGGQPTAWNGAIPEIAEPGDIDVPSSPTLSLPAVPALENIPEVDLPTLSLPTFTASPPDTTLAIPDIKDAPTEDVYSSTNLTELQNQILAVLQGDRGYLDEIWDQIWLRELRNEFDAQNRAIESVTELWGSRGWDAPVGMEAEQLLKIEQDVLYEDMKRAREKAIEQNSKEVERFNFFVSQGIALESQLINYHGARAGRAIQATQLFNDAAIALLQAKVSRLNIELEAYKVQADVYRTLIQAELAKLEKSRIEIENARLKSEINQNRINVYVAQLEGVQKNIDVYVAQLEGVKSRVAIQQQVIDASVARIEGAKLQVQAKKDEYDAWGTKIQGQLGIANIWKTEAEIFATEVDAINKKNQQKTALFDAEIRKGQLSLQKLTANVDKFKALITAEDSRFTGAVQAYTQTINKYNADVSGETNRVNANARQYEARATYARAEADVKLRQGEINANNILRITELENASLGTLMTALASLAAAALQAMDVNASLHGNDSFNWNYNHDCDS